MSDFDYETFTFDLVKTQCRDGYKWAQAMHATLLSQSIRVEQDILTGWLCNAMMAMYDSIHNNEIDQLTKQNEELKERIKQLEAEAERR